MKKSSLGIAVVAAMAASGFGMGLGGEGRDVALAPYAWAADVDGVLDQDWVLIPTLPLGGESDPSSEPSPRFSNAACEHEARFDCHKFDHVNEKDDAEIDAPLRAPVIGIVWRF